MVSKTFILSVATIICLVAAVSSTVTAYNPGTHTLQGCWSGCSQRSGAGGGPCCMKGQMCPPITAGGQPIPCCPTSWGSYSCNHTCVTTCSKNMECGDGSWYRPCTGSGICGKCGPGARCQQAPGSDSSQCKCAWGCQCSGKVASKYCTGCPAPFSPGCGSDSCTCAPPRSAKSVPGRVVAKEVIRHWANGCTRAYAGPCGGFQLVNASTPTPYSIMTGAGRGFESTSSLWVLFHAPSTSGSSGSSGGAFPGTHLYLSFATNNSGVPAGEAFNVQVTNCTQKKYTNCFTQDSADCLKEGSCLQNGNGAVVDTISTKGNGKGIYFKNPGTSPVTLQLTIGDSQAGEAKFFPHGMTLYYNE